MIKYIKYIVLSFCVFSFVNVFDEKEMKQITVYNLDKLTAATDMGFADENFYACVVDAYNSENNASLTVNDSLTDDELATVKKVICREKGIADVSGLEKLTGLNELNLYGNKVSEIDLSSNINLLSLNLTFNKLSSIDVSSNTKLTGLYLNGNKEITSLDVSENHDLVDLNINNNKIEEIDVRENPNLRFVLFSSNKLSRLDLSNNTKLEHVYASGNKISEVLLPNTNTITRLDLHYNKISRIDVSKFTYLEELVLSTNQLTSIDLSENVNLVELYISSNNLSDLQIDNLSKLAHLNAIFNNFESVDIPYPENIINMAIETDWIDSYDLSKFTNLKSLRVSDYYVVPVYGTKFSISNLSKYKSNNIDYQDYVLYKDFNHRESSYVDMANTIDGSLGDNLEYTLCSTNINGYHNSCGTDLPDNVEFTTDSNVVVSNLNDYSGIIFYEGYREFRFMTLESDKYEIGDNTIDVGMDDDATVLGNLSVSWSDANVSVNNNTVQVSYNGELLKEYSLKRITNPYTGSLSFYIVGTVLIASILLVFYSLKFKHSNI